MPAWVWGYGVEDKGFFLHVVGIPRFIALFVYYLTFVLLEHAKILLHSSKLEQTGDCTTNEGPQHYSHSCA
jgi:hypothetical protein